MDSLLGGDNECDKEVTQLDSQSGSEARGEHYIYSPLPGTNSVVKTGRLEGQPSPFEITDSLKTARIIQGKDDNYFSPLRREKKKIIFEETQLQSVPESSSVEGWSTLPSRYRVRPRSSIRHRKTTTLFDWDELNSEIEKIEKDMRRSAIKGKLRKRIRLTPHGGLFEDGLKAMQAVQQVEKNADKIKSVVGGIEAAGKFLQYASTDSSNLLENLVCRLEDIAALIVGLNAASSWPVVFSLLHLYIRSYFPAPITGVVMNSIKDLLGLQGEVLETQSGFEFVTDKASASLDVFKSVLSNWKTAKTSDFAKHVATAVNALVSLGICGNYEQTLGKTKELATFGKSVWMQQFAAVDFVSMVMETIIYFCERGYSAFVHGDLSLLLFSDDEAKQLDSEYSMLVASMPLLECGRLDELAERVNAMNYPGVKPIVDSADYDLRVDNMVGRLTKLTQDEKHAATKAAYGAKLMSICRVRTALIMQQRVSPIRRKPYCIEIFGGSSVAKTTLCNIFARVILHSNGIACTKDHIVTCNDLDKYQSEYTSSKTCVILDDYVNTKAEHYDIAPTKKIIDFCNNVTIAALNAQADKKGNVMIKPDLVLLTTNVKGLLANQFSNEPVSILRRFEVVVTAKLRPEYVDPQTGGPRQEKMCDCAIPDAWLLKLETVHIQRGKVDLADLRSVFSDANGAPRWVGIHECLDFLKKDSNSHYNKQKRYVASVENFFNLELCQHSYPTTECPLCKAVDDDNDMPDSIELDEEGKFVSAPMDFISLDSHAGVEGEFNSEWARLVKCDAEPDAWESLEDEKSIFTILREKRCEMLASCLALSAIVATLTTLKRIYSLVVKVDTQGDTVSKPTRLETDVSNPWKKVKTVPLPVSVASRTIVVEDLVSLLKRKIAFCLIKERGVDEKRRVCDIVPMKGDRWLLPWHMVIDEQKVYEIEVRTTTADTVGKNFRQFISSHEIQRVPNTDYVVVRLAAGGDNVDLSKFLLEGRIDLGWSFHKLYARTVLRLADGSIEESTLAVMNKQPVETPVGHYEAYCYNYSRPTFSGQCMMCLVSETATPAIMGFHLAGRTGESFGAAGIILRSWFESANAELTKRAPLDCHSSGTFPEVMFGKSQKTTDRIPPKHSALWLQDNEEDGRVPVIEVYGAHDYGSVRFKSNVRKSPISEAVDTVMNLPRLHGPPSSEKSWLHWQRDLSLISQPCGMFDPKILRKAVEDFHSYVGDVCSRSEDFSLVHPYDLDTILAGADGITSVDGVDLSTSMGWPINKAKSYYITASERVVPGITRSLDLDPEILEAVATTEQILLSGERCYAINRATKKDEATKFSKKKIRVFAGAQYTTIHLVRKYYLPLVRFIQTHWKEMECAVGINAYGPQWSELAEYMTRHGKDRMIAGDFKAFDKSVSPILLTEAFGILVTMAKKAGYNADQITVMEGLATELCYPLYEWDGVFLQAYGSNPSGHPLTVIINNIVNSLYMRYAYYYIHQGEEVPLFSDRVTLMCYGDDNFQNVHPLETKYTFRTVQEALASVNIVYTTADKDVDRVEELISLDDVSFLKRQFRWDEELNIWMAPLEEASISKSLHNYMHRKGCPILPTQIAAQSIQGALREFFRYDRAYFEKRRQELLQVISIANLGQILPSLPTYEECVAELKGETVPLLAYPLIWECA